MHINVGVRVCLLQTQENQQRATRGEAPLPDEDLSKIFKAMQPPSRLDSLLLSSQITNYVGQINDFATQSFGKLFMADCLQTERKDSK